MRAAFIRTLVELAQRDPRIVLLTGDLGYSVIEPFPEAFPDRFFNVGVAEQNMIGIATGLAEAGYLPFAYSIATFASLRGYEFIRNGPVAHGLPVRIAGVGGGFEYGPAGTTHHALEDVGVLRMQPGLTVVAPADHRQAAAALRATWDLSGPVYYRLGKDDRTEVPGLDGAFELGRLQRVRHGQDAALICLGNITVEAVRAAELLERDSIRCSVAVMSTISPAPVEDLVALLGETPVALTVEAHYAAGGIGSVVAEVAAERGLPCRVVRHGVTALTGGRSGSERFLNARHGLTAEALVASVKHALPVAAR